jgi:hypothetical protein
MEGAQIGRALPGITWFAAACVGLGGCYKEPSLVGRSMRSVKVGTVTDRGMELTPDAPPSQVAFVLLHALRDDVRAAAAADRAAQEAAFQRQLDLCAPDTIYKISKRAYGTYPIVRDEIVHMSVDRWAPIVSAYVDAFDVEWSTAAPRFVETPVRGSSLGLGELTAVLFEVPDPDGDANASVVVQIDLAREQGYWRAYRVGFNHKRRHVGRVQRATTKPTGDDAQT